MLYSQFPSAIYLVCVLSCSVTSDSVTLWTVTCQASQSMGSSRENYWSGLPCPPPDLFYTWYHNVYMSIPILQFIPPSSPLASTRLLSTSAGRQLLHRRSCHPDLLLLGALATVLTSYHAATSSACALTSSTWHGPTCLILPVPRVPCPAGAAT